MIKLIINEFLKLRIIKIVYILFLLFITIFIIVYINRDSKDIFYTSIHLIPFLGLFLAILFGGIISNEYNAGTMRIYLTKPVKRYKVYLSKLIMMFMTIIIILLSIIIFYFIIFLLLKINISKINHIDKLLLCSIPLFFISVLILSISTITKSTSMSVGISLFLLLFSNIISQIFFGIKLTFIEYTFLPYLDFTIFEYIQDIKSMNIELGINLSINKGIVILIVYSILIFVISCYKFINTDINN